SSATAQASLDKSSYKISDSPIVTIEDANGNVDPSEADVVYAGIRSETSDPNFIVLTLTETGNNSNTFEGTFEFTRGDSSSIDGVLQAASGDELDISYVSGARFQATIDRVVESGLVDLSDYIVEDSACFRSVGSGVDLEFVDSAIGPDGNIAVTMSYANVVLGGIDPSSLVIWHKVDSTWNALDSSVDLNEKTVSASTQSPGPFSLGSPNEDCAGGAGGGAGFGRGVVVDFVASLANRGGGGGGDSGTTSGGNTGAPSSSNNLSPGQDVSTT